MSLISRPFWRTYRTYPTTTDVIGRSGKASWFPDQGPQYTSQSASSIPHAGAQWFQPAKPTMMMDPSDPTTWQRPYVFTS